MHRFAQACLVALAVAIAAPGTAQTYPAKPIRIIVPAAVDSPPDAQTRWIASELSRALGQPIVIDHRPGAGGAVGARVAVAVRRAPFAKSSRKTSTTRWILSVPCCFMCAISAHAGRQCLVRRGARRFRTFRLSPSTTCPMANVSGRCKLGS